jgi:hypothetical protein
MGFLDKVLDQAKGAITAPIDLLGGLSGPSATRQGPSATFQQEGRSASGFPINSGTIQDILSYKPPSNINPIGNYIDLLKFASRAGELMPGNSNSNIASGLPGAAWNLIWGPQQQNNATIGNALGSALEMFGGGNRGNSGLNRITPYDDRVVSKLTPEQFVKPFASKDRDKILAETTKIVLDTMEQQMGMPITPEMRVAMLERADMESIAWAEKLRARGQERSAHSYYEFLNDIALDLLRNPPVTASTPATTTTTAPATTSTTTNVAQPAPTERPIDPITGKTYGTGAVEFLDKPAQTMDAATWGVGRWAYGQPGPFGLGPEIVNDYLSWAQTTLADHGPQVDVSPEAWDRYYGMSEYMKDHPNG